MASQTENLDLAKMEDQKQVIDKVEILKNTKIIYTKPIAIIYNPNSGKKRNI